MFNAARQIPLPVSGHECTILQLSAVFHFDLVGAILTGVFASEAIGGAGGAIEGNWMQVWTQTWGALAAAIYCGVVTTVILFVQSKIMPMRVDEEGEISGLDTTLHGESVG